MPEWDEDDIEAIEAEEAALWGSTAPAPSERSAEPVAAGDDAASLFEWMESRLTLHEGVEFLYLVDGYEASITMHDGATTAHVARGPTLVAAARALKALAEARGQGTAT